MDFVIVSTDEYGRQIPTVHYASGGVRPATSTEVDLWHEIERLRNLANTKMSCKHQSTSKVLTEVGWCEQCRACGYQDFTVQFL